MPRCGGWTDIATSELRVALDLHVGPENPELELDGVERLGADLGVPLERGHDEPRCFVPAQDFERAKKRVDQPNVPHLLSRVDRELAYAIDDCGAGRKDFARPVGVKRKVRY